MAWSQAAGKDFSDVDPTLLGLLQRAAGTSPYNVSAISGYRKGDPRQHGRGNATDVQLTDPKTGKALANYQDPSTFKAYQDYANSVYGAATPEQQQQLRWGGYFSGGKGKYGALDLMHFDINSGIPMGGGSWAGGVTPAQARIWGMQPGGGVSGQQPGEASMADYRAGTAGDKPVFIGTPPATPALPDAPPAGDPGFAAPTAKPEESMLGGLRKRLAKGAAAFKMPAVASPGNLLSQAPPQAARVDTPEVSNFDPNQIAQQRQQLAMAMQRLNSGKLWT